MSVKSELEKAVGETGCDPAELLAALRGTGRRVAMGSVGICMLPVVPPGARLEIDFAPASDVRRGDVILFLQNDRPVLHRVVGITVRGGKRVFVEKADRAFRRGLVPEDRYLGRLVRSVRGVVVYTPLSPRGRSVSMFFLALSRVEGMAAALGARVPGSRAAGRIALRTGQGLRRLFMRAAGVPRG